MAARGFQHGLGRSRVPFHGSAEARIEIGLPLRQAAELHRRADIGERGDLAALEILGKARIIRVVARRHHVEAGSGRWARVDGLAPARGILAPGASSDDAEIGLPGGRQGNRAEIRPPVAHQPDIDSELIAAGGELARSVKRIDKPEAPRSVGGPARRHLLLGDHRDIWGRFAQPGHDQRFRRAVGFRDGRCV